MATAPNRLRIASPQTHRRRHYQHAPLRRTAGYGTAPTLRWLPSRNKRPLVPRVEDSNCPMLRHRWMLT